MAEFIEYVWTEWENFTRFVSTRWLCLERCCDKEYRKFEGLKSMFLSRSEKESRCEIGDGLEAPENMKNSKNRFSRLQKAFRDPLTEIHLLFFSSSLQLFTSYNKFLQRSDPLAHNVYPMTQELIKKIAMRIMKHEVIRQGITLESLADEENYLPIKDVYVGLTTKKLLQRKFENGEITQKQHDTCLLGAQSFYRTSLEYVLTKMDMRETLWSHAVWINFFRREESSWSNVEYFVHNFKSLLQFDDHETDMLYEQFIDYQMVETNEFPSTALNDAILLEHQDGTVEYRIDTIWYHLKQMRSPVGNNLRFNLLFKVAQIILLIPHSNACIERVFSLNKIFS